MIVRNLQELTGTNRHINSPTSDSTRMLLADDDVGFSLNVTRIEAGLELRMRYQHHYEAVYCISGTGSIEDEATGAIHAIAPGTLYALDRHDAHVLRSDSQLELVCIFNPALVGTETKDSSGGYPPP